MRFGQRREFESIIFFGGPGCGAEAFKLVEMLVEATDILSGLQQPPHSDSDEAAKRAREEFIEGETALRVMARDIVKALTGHEIQFLPEDVLVIRPAADWEAVKGQTKQGEGL